MLYVKPEERVPYLDQERIIMLPLITTSNLNVMLQLVLWEYSTN